MPVAAVVLAKVVSSVSLCQGVTSVTTADTPKYDKKETTKVITMATGTKAVGFFASSLHVARVLQPIKE